MREAVTDIWSVDCVLLFCLQLSPTADVLAEWAEILTPARFSEEEKSEVDQEATQVIFRIHHHTYKRVDAS